VRTLSIELAAHVPRDAANSEEITVDGAPQAREEHPELKPPYLGSLTRP